MGEGFAMGEALPRDSAGIGATIQLYRYEING